MAESSAFPPPAFPDDGSHGDTGGPPRAAVERFREAERLVLRRQPLQALQTLHPVLDAQPDSPSVLQLAGRAYLASAQLQRAEATLRRLLLLDPSDHYAHLALGRTLQRQNRMHEARSELRIAEAMNPTPEYTEVLNEVLAQIAARG